MEMHRHSAAGQIKVIHVYCVSVGLGSVLLALVHEAIRAVLPKDPNEQPPHPADVGTES